MWIKSYKLDKYRFIYYISDVFTVKRRLRNYRREMSHKRLRPEVEELGLKTRSGRVVLTAIAMYVWSLCGTDWCICLCVNKILSFFSEMDVISYSNFVLGSTQGHTVYSLNVYIL
jgi:hypothetical protein